MRITFHVQLSSRTAFETHDFTGKICERPYKYRFFFLSQICSNECNTVAGCINDSSNIDNIVQVISPWSLFAILFRGKAVNVVNPRAWAISRVTGLSKRLSGFGPACLIVLIQQWHIGNGNGTIARSLSGAILSEKLYYESRRISDNNAQMFRRNWPFDLFHSICTRKTKSFCPAVQGNIPD